MKNKKTISRNLGLDIARICAMCGIIILHILGQGGVLSHISAKGARYWIIWWIEICAYCAVDLFALLSGWLGIKKKKYSTYRTLELMAIVIFYCIIITVCFFITIPDCLSSGKDIIKSLAPYLVGRYWYITCYIPIAILQPFINKMLLGLSEKQHKQVCILCILGFALIPSIFNYDFFAFNRGYSFGWLVICYMIGAYLHRVEDKIKEKNIRKRKYFILFLTCSIVLLLGKASFDYIFNVDAHYFIEYTSPLVLLMAVVAMLFMGQLKIKRTSIMFEKMSIVAFDVYIIHCHILIFDILICNHFKWIVNMPDLLIPIIVVGVSVVIYFVLATIGLLRSILFDKVRINFALKKVANKIDNIIYVDVRKKYEYQ